MNDYDDSEDYSSANSFRARSNTWPLNRPDITIPSGICIDEALPEIELEDDDLFTTNENWSSGLDHDIMSWDPFLNAQNHETHQHNNISTNTSNHHHNNNHHQHHSLSILDPAAPLPPTDPTALYQQQNFHNNMPYTELQVFNPHLEYISAPQQAQIEAQVPANSYSSASAIVPPISQIEAEQQQQQQHQQQQQQHLQQSIHETLHETLHEPVHESVHEHYNEVSVMSQHHHHQDQQQPIHLSHDMTSSYAPAHTDVPSCPSPLHLVSNQSNSTTSSKTKLNTPRRNAWGNMSYADLISQAINSTNDKRLTLSQIYDWMVQHVPYFKDKGDSNSSAGWKNSVRHNLSLHNRFKRLQNEGTGKSSWWTINPEANIGKCARRRAASMEASKYEKKRGRAKKRAEAIRQGLAVYPSLTSSSLNDSALALDQSPTDSFSAQQSQSEPQQQPSRQKLSQTQRHLHTDADGLSSNNLQNGQPDATGLYVTSQHDSQYESTDNIMQQQQQQSPYFMPFTLNV